MDATAVRKPTDKTKGLLCLLLAAALLGAIAFFYASIADSGLHVYDERAFIAIAHRFVKGDRPFADDWSTALTLSFFLALPVKAFTAVTGSTEGIVLFCRYCFIAVHTAFSAFLCFRLRKKGWAAVVAALLYMCYIPLEMFSLNYNPISLMAAVSFCLLLFTGKEPGRGKLFAAGIIAAVAVVALPPLALLYPLCSLWLLIRFLVKRKTGTAPRQDPLYLRPAGWGWLTAGIAACAAVFSGYLLSQASFPELLSALPGILTQVDSSFHSNLSAERFLGVVNTLGPAQCVCAAPILGFALFGKNRNAAVKGACFALAVIDTIAMYVSVWRVYFGSKGDVPGDVFAVLMRSVPLVLAGAAAGLLTARRDDGTWRFFLFCLVYALLRDVSSNIIFGLGSVGANIASVMLIADFLRERRREGSAQAKGFPTRLTACLCLLAIAAPVGSEALWKTEESRYRVLETYYIKTRDPLTDEIGRGPLKGIKTTARVCSTVNHIMDDLDTLRRNGCGKIYIAGTHQWAYLYLEDSYTACSAMFSLHNIADSQMYYWELHPDKRPDAVYIPLFDTERYQLIRTGANMVTDVFSSLCSFRQTEGRAGYLLSDIEWNAAPTGAEDARDAGNG